MKYDSKLEKEWNKTSRNKHNCNEIKNSVGEEKYVLEFKEKTSVDEFNRRLDKAEEKANELEDSKKNLSREIGRNHRGERVSDLENRVRKYKFN